jgi:L-ornithine N5-monooxygenase
MPHALPHDEEPIYDLVGVGFGPSNLALAIALDERNAASGVDRATTAVFFERQARFGWHRGMLIDDATMQVSFFKDLVTLRNPTSRFSFLSYLHSRGRLIDFVNHKNLFPLRAEFHDYLEWAAAKVDDVVHYGHEVADVQPVFREGEAVLFDVIVRAGDQTVAYRARNVVLATGLRPVMPHGVARSERIWHNCELLTRIEGLAGASPARFVVVGAGQSAAEVTAFLHDRFQEAEVCCVFSRYGYSPADDSCFANRIFDPAAVDDFFGAPPDVKSLLLDYHRNTNYSVVDGELIDDLYRRVYREKVLGTTRLRLFNASRLAHATQTATAVRVGIESLTSGEQTALDADIVVCATGYHPADPFALLGQLTAHCRCDELGRPMVERDYRMLTTPTVRGGIYLQGGTEHTHGISSSLLSNAAIRAGDILESIAARSHVEAGAKATVSA